MADLSSVKAELALDWARIGPFSTCDLLGLKYRKENRCAFVCCPWHAERTPSCTITIGPEGTIRVHCFGCAQTWDVHALFAQVQGLEIVGSAFKELLIREAEVLTRWDLVEALEGKKPEPRPIGPMPTPVRTEVQAEPERLLPDRNEVLDFIGACIPVESEETVCHWLRTRALDPHEIAVRGLAYAIPEKISYLPRWACFKGQSWIETGHWLIIPVYDHLGEVVSVRASRVVDGDSPKRLPPSGCRISRTIMADAMGMEVLRAGGWPEWNANDPVIVIAEGEPDFFTWALTSPLLVTPTNAVFGIFSGSWCDEFASRIPTGAKVAIWTDQDDAGEKYFQFIGKSLAKRCTIYRGRLFNG